MFRIAAWPLWIAIVSSCASAFAQDTATAELSPKQILKRSAMFYGYPGTMAFHTAFHGCVTTRYLLLKASPRVAELEAFLDLDEEQKNAVSKLPLLDIETLRTERADAMGDTNAEPDEELVDANYFGFLSADQLGRLDRLALVFDGFPALSRRSNATRLKLSQETRAAIARVLATNRKDIYLPYFRYSFAALLPADHEYLDCEFAGKFITQLNHAIIDILSPAEAQRFVAWFGQDPPPDELVEAIKSKSPLPGGLFAFGESLIASQKTVEPTEAPAR